MPITRPAVSQHLKILKDAGLVLDERAGSRRIYRVSQDGLSKLRADLDSFWNDTLTAYKDLVEQTEHTSTDAGQGAALLPAQPPGGTP